MTDKIINNKTSDLEDYEVISRHLIQGKDLNPFGNVFGGQMLSWLDESSYIYLVTKTGYSNFVTVNMDNVNFRAPAKLGDVITFYGKLLNTGKSSATVSNSAFVHEPGRDSKIEIINCSITFVALKNGKPFPFFKKS